MKQVVDNFTRFHPKPEEIFMSDPQEEPEFIKPYFGLRMFPVWHIGSNFLHEIAKTWYSYLLDKGVKFIWNCEVIKIDFKNSTLIFNDTHIGLRTREYDTLIFAVGKSGIDFAQKLADDYQLPNEPKSVQIDGFTPFMATCLDYTQHIEKNVNDVVDVRVFTKDGYKNAVFQVSTVL